MRISNRGKQKMPITCLSYRGCEIRASLFPDSRDFVSLPFLFSLVQTTLLLLAQHHL